MFILFDIKKLRPSSDDKSLDLSKWREPMENNNNMRRKKNTRRHFAQALQHEGHLLQTNETKAQGGRIFDNKKRKNIKAKNGRYNMS